MKLTVNIGEAQKLSGPSQTPKLGQQQFAEPKEWWTRNKGYKLFSE